MAAGTPNGMRGGLLGLAVVAAFVFLAAHAIYFAGTAAWADAITLKARWTLDYDHRPRSPALWTVLAQDVEEGLKWTPGNPDLYERLGYIQAIQAGVPGTEKKQTLLRALANYRRAASLRPMSPYTWANIAYVLHRINSDPKAMWAGFDLAMAYGRGEVSVQTVLAEIGYARVAELSLPQRKSLRQSFDAARGSLRTTLAGIGRKNGIDPKQL
jgi:hypothetical protein